MRLSLLILLLISVLQTGCTLESVKPWERNLLAEDKMQLIPDPTENYLDEHIFFSKESAFGGQGVGGGGCGCN